MVTMRIFGLRGNSSSGNAAFSSGHKRICTFARSIEHQKDMDLIGVDKILQFLTFNKLLWLFTEAEQSLNALDNVALLEIHLKKVTSIIQNIAHIQCLIGHIEQYKINIEMKGR